MTMVDILLAAPTVVVGLIGLVLGRFLRRDAKWRASMIRCRAQIIQADRCRLIGNIEKADLHLAAAEEELQRAEHFA